jgi:hypothetical protein
MTTDHGVILHKKAEHAENIQLYTCMFIESCRLHIPQLKYHLLSPPNNDQSFISNAFANSLNTAK